MKNGKLYVDEVAIIRPLTDSRETLKALKAAREKKFIYHTSNEQIVMDVVMKPMVRGIHS